MWDIYKTKPCFWDVTDPTLCHTRKHCDTEVYQYFLTPPQYFKAHYKIQWHISNQQLYQKKKKKKGGKSCWPSPLITQPTMAQLTTWQACLAKGISFLNSEVGAAESEWKKINLQSMSCHTMSKWGRAIWPARLQYLTPQWQLDPIMAEHFSELARQSSYQTDTPNTKWSEPSFTLAITNVQ